jgi:enoyl-CoA hydratase
MHDFKEGIDTKIAGKGRPPSWTPDTVSQVDDASVEQLFETPVPDELELSQPKQIS